MQYILTLRQKYEKLMAGRYGFDTLSGDALVLWFVTGFINGFVRSRIFALAALLLPIFAGVRMFSKNIAKRSAENEKYLSFRRKAADFFKLSYKKFSERKTHRYYKCSNCDAQLRVKREKGRHTVVCPKCGKELHVKIR